MSQLPHQTARLPHYGPLPAVDESPAELIRNAATLLALLGTPERREDGTRMIRFGAGAVFEIRHLIARAIVKLETPAVTPQRFAITPAGRAVLDGFDEDDGPGLCSQCGGTWFHRRPCPAEPKDGIVHRVTEGR